MHRHVVYFLRWLTVYIVIFRELVITRATAYLSVMCVLRTIIYNVSAFFSRLCFFYFSTRLGSKKFLDLCHDDVRTIVQAGDRGSITAGVLNLFCTFSPLPSNPKKSKKKPKRQTEILTPSVFKKSQIYQIWR